jgi:small subunit ribosomal protein S1
MTSTGVLHKNDTGHTRQEKVKYIQQFLNVNRTKYHKNTKDLVERSDERLENMTEEKLERQPDDSIAPEEESGQEENFAALFEKDSNLPGRIEPGQKVTSTIVSISGDFVYVSLGGKSEGVIDIGEFRDEEGKRSVNVGDQVESYFVAVQGGLKRLTTLRHGLSTLSLKEIRDAFEAGLPVNGKVIKELKGGFEVHVGKIRCFCPFSQIDLRGFRDSDTYTGETFPFRVLEFQEDDRNVILSRRALLEEEQAAKVEELKKQLSVGMDVPAKVRAIQSFGVFVDLGGIDGLIPMSEIGWGKVDNIQELLQQGSGVTVRIIALDWERERLTLSLKALQPDPFLSAAERYQVGSLVRGTIVRLAPFGVFVNLEPGIDGLVHISKLGAGRRIKHPKEVVEVGQTVEAYVQEVDVANRRISLSLEQKVEPEAIVLPEAGEVLQGTVEKVLTSGILVKLPGGAIGFIPNSEMGTPRGANHNRMFPFGTPLQVIVVEINQDRGRITLSRSGVEEKLEKEALSSYMNKAQEDDKTGSTLGSFGELLKAAMDKNG